MRHSSSRISDSKRSAARRNRSDRLSNPCRAKAAMWCPAQSFIDELQRSRHQYGILLIFDEVQCGMGRTGKMFAAEHFDVVARYLHARERYRERIAAVGHSRAGRNDELGRRGRTPPLSAEIRFHCRLARHNRAARRELDRERRAHRRYTYDRMPQTGRRGSRCRRCSRARLMIGIELVHDQETKERAPELRDRLEMMAFERGLLCSAPARTASALSAAGDHEGSGGFRRGYTGGVSDVLERQAPRQSVSMSAAESTNTRVPSVSTAIPAPAPTCSRTSTASPTRLPTAPSTVRGDPCDRARLRRDPHHGGISPPASGRAALYHRDSALHRLQLFLRSHPSVAPEQLLAPLLRRRARRLRLLFPRALPRDFRAREATSLLAISWL